MIKILYDDNYITVCIKPSGVLSTDEEGGMPELLRNQLGCRDIHTVHRLDRVVGGLMVFAKNRDVAASLGKQITAGTFEKEYLAIVHGHPEDTYGRFDDLLFRDTFKGMTYPVKRMRKGVREASLLYEVLGDNEDFSKVRVHLLTGRTHQIRVQFSSRRMPIFGDKKYGAAFDEGNIALYSAYLCFNHPVTGEQLEFSSEPPEVFPWNLFEGEY